MKETKEEVEFNIELPPHQPTPAGFYETETRIEYACPYTVRYYIFRDLLDYYRKNDSQFDTGKNMEQILKEAKQVEKYILEPYQYEATNR